MGFTEACFDDREDELIDQALGSDHPWIAGITRERLEREGQVAPNLPVDDAGETLPFSTAEWFKTPSGRGELSAGASVHGAGGIAGACCGRERIRWSFFHARRTTI